MAALLGFTACSSDDNFAEPQDNETATTITVSLPDGFSTRAATGGSDSKLSGYQNTGGKATIYLAMYRANATDGAAPVWHESKTAESGKATFSISYVAGANVKFVGYATVGDKTVPFSTGDELRTLTVENSLNDEELDAFSGTATGAFGEVTGLTLHRPSCKVRLISTDWPTAASAGVEVTNVEVVSRSEDGAQTYLLPYSQFNAMSAEYSGSAATTTLSATSVPAYSAETDETEKTMFVDYIPVNDGAVVNTPLAVRVTYTVDGNERTREIDLPNVPVKRNRLITIKGSVFVQTSVFTVIIDDELTEPWDGTTQEEPAQEDGTYQVGTAQELAWVLTQSNWGTASKVSIAKDIDLAGKTIVTKGLDVKDMEIDGNGHTITGLTCPLIPYTWAGAKTLVIKNLTIDASAIQSDIDDAKEDVGVGAFVGWPQAFGKVTLENCHLTNSSVKGGHWAGGLIGIAAGYSGNDGPVFEQVEINNCSVENCTIESKGSVGAVIGHGTSSAWTSVKVNGGSFTGNTLISTGSATDKAGWLIGTVGVAGVATTVNGVTHTGGVWFQGCQQSGNTATSGGVTVSRIYGRYGNESGRLYVDGMEATGKN